MLEKISNSVLEKCGVYKVTVYLGWTILRGKNNYYAHNGGNNLYAWTLEDIQELIHKNGNYER